MRPLWNQVPNSSITDWSILGNDVINLLEQEKLRNIFLVGHSIGGTLALMSLIKRPYLFSKVILLDPVLFPSSMFLVWKIVKYFSLELKIHPLAMIALKRRKIFKSYDELFYTYRKKQIFSKLTDEYLKIYIRSISMLNNKNIELIYSRKLESDIYLSGLRKNPIAWDRIKNIDIPMKVIYPNCTNTFPLLSRIKLKNRYKNFEFLKINNNTHLFPMEDPHNVANEILSF